MTTKFMDADGRVLDHEIAEEMAYIEKPYRENKLGIIKSIFIGRASEILKGQEKSEEFLNKKIEFEKKLEEELRLAEEKRIAEEKKAEEDRIKKEQEEIGRDLVNNTILNSEENFKKFLSKLENIDMDLLGFYTTKNGEQEIYGRVDGVKVEITLKRHKKYDGKILGERFYSYYWRYTGKLNGVYLKDEYCKTILEKYREVQSKITGTRDTLPSNELKYIKLMNEGNYSLHYNNKVHGNDDKFEKDSNILGITPNEVKEKSNTLYGTIGENKIEITTYEVRGYTQNTRTSTSDDISGRIDGARISKKLAAMIRTKFHQQAAKAA
ncbi:hypothetical protein M0P65_02340 [Candidatus Gracilibacteria bacterium]|nr:hypothetical protein [Candidatus Gracilibacteria bacterium]